MNPLTTYGQRLALAMGFPDEDPPPAAKHALAKAVGITYTAISKYFKETSKAMASSNNAKAARHLRVDPDWLATGEGRMRSERVWPFGDAVTPEQYFSLDAASTQPVIDLLKGALQRAGVQAGQERDKVGAATPGQRAAAPKSFKKPRPELSPIVRATQRAAASKKKGP